MEKQKEQLALYHKAKLEQQRGGSAEYICSLAQQALELTKPVDVYPDCKSKEYTYVELELLLILIECGHEFWKDVEKGEIGLLKIIQYARLYFEEKKCENIESRAWQILLADADRNVN